MEHQAICHFKKLSSHPNHRARWWNLLRRFVKEEDRKKRIGAHPRMQQLFLQWSNILLFLWVHRFVLCLSNNMSITQSNRREREKYTADIHFRDIQKRNCSIIISIYQNYQLKRGKPLHICGEMTRDKFGLLSLFPPGLLSPPSTIQPFFSHFLWLSRIWRFRVRWWSSFFSLTPPNSVPTNTLSIKCNIVGSTEMQTGKHRAPAAIIGADATRNSIGSNRDNINYSLCNTHKKTSQCPPKKRKQVFRTSEVSDFYQNFRSKHFQISTSRVISEKWKYTQQFLRGGYLYVYFLLANIHTQRRPSNFLWLIWFNFCNEIISFRNLKHLGS